MKIIFALSLLILGCASSQQFRECPTARAGCMYTLDYNPVCSTLGCTYSNLGHMECAGGTLWYYGECREPYRRWN